MSPSTMLASTPPEAQTGSMGDLVFERSVTVPASRADVWAWHVRPGAFERLAPPWGAPRLRAPHPGVFDGSRVDFDVPVLGPLSARWVAEHRDVVQGERFTDVQVRGLFSKWEHTHSLHDEGEGRTRLVDRIVWRPPLGAFARVFAVPFIERDLERVFSHRHRVLRRDLARHASAGTERTMKVLVSGASGMLGNAVCSLLSTGGHDVVRLVRREARGAGEVQWDPAAGRLDAQALQGVDAVVHLAGENIAARRWSDEQKARILDSRVQGTTLIAQALASLDVKPSVFVCASAVGYYGSRGDEQLDETSAAGSGFLADVCKAWETACQPARDAGIRTVNLRFGAILSPQGGALAKMLLPFKLGAGGRLGSGEQFMSWIAIDDAAGAVLHALTHDELSGPVNAVAPQPVTNVAYTKALGRVLGRPTIFPMPGFAARLAFGELADELLLASQRAVPDKLLASGFTFDEPEVEGALRSLLGKTG